MNWWSDTAAILAISQLAVFGLFFLIHHAGTQSRLLGLFSVCMIAYLVAQLSLIEAGSLGAYLLNRFSTATPLVLWLFAFSLFVDDGRVKPLAWLLIGFFVIVRAIGVPLYDPAGPNSYIWFAIIYFIPQIVLLGFSLHTIWLAVTGYQHDLVNDRRVVRVVFVICMGIVLSFIVGNGFFSFADPFLSQMGLFSIGPLPEILFPLYLFITALCVNLTIFRLRDNAFDLLSAPSRAARQPAHPIRKPGSAQSAALEKVIKAMEVDALFTDSNLTISNLAKTLSMQEYRLRRLINQQLDYRNFNQFLNHYRIREACKLLAQTDSAISTIAMDVGYSSLSSFNKAFKDIQGTTPSAYRHSHSQEEIGQTTAHP